MVLSEIGVSGFVLCAGLGVIFYYSANENLAESDGFFIGVDGGGTKTMVVLIDRHGGVKGRAVVGSSNQNSVGEASAEAALREGIKQVVEQAGISYTDIKGIWLSMSGVDRPENIERVKSWLSHYIPKDCDISVSSDAYGALASGTEGELRNNLVMICGTGSICVGFDQDQNPIRTGGWGPIIGDPASGHYLGSRLLEAVADHADGGEQTMMYQMFMDKYGLKKKTDIIPWAYSGKEWSDIAALGVLVYEAASKGDIVAQKIIDDTVVNIGRQIELTISKMDKCDNIVLSGGNFAFENSILYTKVKELLSDKYPTTNIVLPTTDPAEAAALLAKNRYLD